MLTAVRLAGRGDRARSAGPARRGRCPRRARRRRPAARPAIVSHEPAHGDRGLARGRCRRPPTGRGSATPARGRRRSPARGCRRRWPPDSRRATQHRGRVPHVRARPAGRRHPLPSGAPLVAAADRHASRSFTRAPVLQHRARVQPGRRAARAAPCPPRAARSTARSGRASPTPSAMRTGIASADENGSDRRHDRQRGVGVLERPDRDEERHEDDQVDRHHRVLELLHARDERARDREQAGVEREAHHEPREHDERDAGRGAGNRERPGDHGEHDRERRDARELHDAEQPDARRSCRPAAGAAGSPRAGSRPRARPSPRSRRSRPIPRSRRAARRRAARR